MFGVYVDTAEDMEMLGRALGSLAKEGDVFLLEGELGTGKTTLTKGIAMGLNIKTDITSPTFTLIKEYGGRCDLYHFDLYRLEDEKELMKLGFEEYVYGEGVTVIERADYLDYYLPENYLLVKISRSKEKDGREVDFSPVGERYEDLVEELEVYDYSWD